MTSKCDRKSLFFQVWRYFNPWYGIRCGFVHSVICTQLCLFLLSVLVCSVHALLALALMSAVLVEGQRGENLHNTIWQEQLAVSPQGSLAHSRAPELYVWISPFAELGLALGQMEARRSWSWKVTRSRMTKITYSDVGYNGSGHCSMLSLSSFSNDLASRSSYSVRFYFWRHPKYVFVFLYNMREEKKKQTFAGMCDELLLPSWLFSNNSMYWHLFLLLWHSK